MPPPHLRYAITDRHLLAPHQRPPAPSPLSSQEHARSRNSEAAPEPEHVPPGTGEALASPLRMAGAGAEHQPDLPTLALSLRPLLDQALYLAHESVDFFQLREKDLPLPELLALAQALRELLPSGSGPRLLLNLGHRVRPPADLLELALAARLDGLHLPSTLAPNFAVQARSRFAAAGLPPPILSASVHSPAEIATVLPASLDLLLFGPVFGKVVHGQPVQPALGLAALADAVRLARSIPVLALGGLTPANTPATLASGAAGIASIRLFLPTRVPELPPPAQPVP